MERKRERKARQFFRCDKGKTVSQEDITDHTLLRLPHRDLDLR